MPLFYKRRGLKGNFTSTQLQNAVDDIREHNTSVRAVAKKHGINRLTLSRYLKASNESPQTKIVKKSMAATQVFTPSEELSLAEYIKTSSKMLNGFNKIESRQLAYKFAAQKGKAPPSWIKNQAAGDAWLIGFRKRQGICLRSPEATSLACSPAFNKPVVQPSSSEQVPTKISENSSSEVLIDFDPESAQLAKDSVRRSSGPNQDYSELTASASATTTARDAPDCISICFPVIVNDCSWSRNKDGTGSNNDMDMNEKLKEWVIKSGTPAVHVNSLLEILGSHFPQLPKDYDTLLQTRKACLPIIIEKCEADWEDIGATVLKDTDDNQKGEKSASQLQTSVNTIDVDCSAGKRSCPWRHPSGDSSADENFCHKRKKTTYKAKSKSVPAVVDVNASHSISNRLENSRQESSSALCNNWNSSIEDNEENLSERDRLIFTMMSEMKGMINNNTLCLNNIVNEFGSDYVMGAVDEFNLPMKSEFDIQKMEEDLLDKVKFKKLVRYLSTLGGFSPKGMISRLMPRLFTNELTLNYNWTGKPPKKALGKLRIALVIKEATKESALNLTEAETEDAARFWLENVQQYLTECGH